MSSHREKSIKSSSYAACATIFTALLIAAMVAVLPSSAHAVITVNHLTQGGDGSQQETYTTASISPGANRLILAWVSNSDNKGTLIPTLSGNGLTWVQVSSVVYNTENRITLFRAMGAAPAAGAVSIAFGAGNAQKSCVWSIDEYDGVDTSGANGAGAIVQNRTGANDAAGPSGLTITLPAAIAGGNITAGGFVNQIPDPFGGPALTPGSGYIGFPQAYFGMPSLDTMSEWRVDGSTTVNATQSGSYPIAGIAVEIKLRNLSMVKQLWDVNGTAPISSPGKAPRGATVVFLIFVRNTSAAAANNVRITDILDQTAFDYVPGSLVSTPSAPPADTATNLQIFQQTAPGTGNGLTDIASAADEGSAQPPGAVTLITIGSVPAQPNKTLNIGAHKTFAFRFQVKVK